MISVEHEIERLGTKVDEMKSTIEKLIDSEGERLRNIKWAAWYCDVSMPTIHNWINKRGFPFVKPEGNNSPLKFRKCEIDNWIKENCK